MKCPACLFAAFSAALITVSEAAIVTGLTLTGNGSVSGDISGDSLSFTLTGGNDGSFLFSSTQLLGSVSEARSFSFLWSYFTNDGHSSWDPSGYVINGVKTFLIDSPETTTGSGTATVALAAGDSFGWFVDSTDNVLGSAALAITASNSSVSAVPEPSSHFALLALGSAGLLTRRRLKRKA